MRAFLCCWISVLHRLLFSVEIRWMNEWIILLLRFSLERKTRSCPQGSPAPWLSCLYSRHRRQCGISTSVRPPTPRIPDWQESQVPSAPSALPRGQTDPASPAPMQKGHSSIPSPPPKLGGAWQVSGVGEVTHSAGAVPKLFVCDTWTLAFLLLLEIKELGEDDDWRYEGLWGRDTSVNTFYITQPRA